VAERGVLTPTLLTCVALSVLVHVAIYALNVVLPLHLVALGGSKTQVGVLFSVSGIVSMFLRPVVGGWVDRFGVRPVLVPGVVALALSSAAFHLAGTPAGMIALMVGLGSASALISTAAGVLAAGAAAPAVRGEALSIYYMAAPVAMVVGAPMGLALMQVGGASLSFTVVTGVAILLLALALLPTTRVRGHGGAGSRFRLGSRHALGASLAICLVAVGASSLYAFVPLHAMRHGLGAHVGWFFALYSVWLLACRLLLRGTSDRLGHERVLVAAMTATALGFLVLALPPTPTSLAAAALLLGAGASVFFPALVALVIARTPAREHGLAIGTLSGAFDAGVVVGSLLIAVVVERFSFGPGFAAASASTLAGLAVFVLAERRRRTPPGFPAPGPGV
jgi:predicted MFS family arabinose efflux permease